MDQFAILLIDGERRTTPLLVENESVFYKAYCVKVTMEYSSVFKSTHLHYAELLRRGQVIASSRNRAGSRSLGCGYDDNTIHAERAVVKRLGDTSQLRGCVLTVVRINKQGKILNSEPCYNCIKFLDKCIKKYGLLKVLYSSNEGSTQCTHDITDSHSYPRKDRRS